MNGLHFDDSADMRSGFHFVTVEAARRATVHRAALDGGDKHSGKAGVQTKPGGAGYFCRTVGATDRLADERKVQRVLQRRIGRRLESGSSGEKFFKSDLTLSGSVQDKAIFRAAFGTRHIPLSDGGREKHLSSGGAGLAQIVVRSANATAAAGELLAILRIEVGLHDSDSPPIAAELLCHDHRERCTNALPHLGLAAPDLHSAIDGKLEPSVG